MKVKLTGDISGLRDGKPWPKRGAVIDVPDDEAQALIDSDMAERAKEAPATETATPRGKGKTETR